MTGFLSKKQCVPSAAVRLSMKLCSERCRERSARQIVDVFELNGELLAEIVYDTEHFSTLVRDKHTHTILLFD
jgi:hypothetical protein